MATAPKNVNNKSNYSADDIEVLEDEPTLNLHAEDPIAGLDLVGLDEVEANGVGV